MDIVELTARATIADVIARYCHVIDRRQWDDVARCFHDDATYRFGPIDGGWRDFVTAARTIIDPLRISHHQTGNMLININGERADVETYFTAYHRIAADAAPDAPLPGTGSEYDIIIAGRYVDRFELRAGDWRISHRTGVTDWRRDGAAADNGLFAQPPAWRGSIGNNDPGRVL